MADFRYNITLDFSSGIDFYYYGVENQITASIDCTSSLLCASVVKFKSNNTIDTSYYKTYIIIDDKPLSNHNRTISSEIRQVFVENKNWNSTTSRYYKKQSSSGRKVFVLSWSRLPHSRYHTVDKRFGRDYLKELASDPGIHVLKIVNDDSSGVTPYTETSFNVFISGYNESLVRRDLNSDIYYWDCSITFEEA